VDNKTKIIAAGAATITVLALILATGIGDTEVVISDLNTTLVETANGEAFFCNSLWFGDGACVFPNGDDGSINKQYFCGNTEKEDCFTVYLNWDDYAFNEKNKLVCKKDAFTAAFNSVCSSTAVEKILIDERVPDSIFYIVYDGNHFRCPNNYANDLDKFYSNHCELEIVKIEIPKNKFRVHMTNKYSYLCPLNTKEWVVKLCTVISG